MSLFGSTTRRTVALGATAALLAGPAALLVSAPAHADVERHGNCGGGRYELSVDPDDGGYDVSADLDRVAPRTKWRVVLRHDGKVVANRVLRADREGDLDLDRWRPNTRGADKFSFAAKRVGGTAKCSATITMR